MGPGVSGSTEMHLLGAPTRGLSALSEMMQWELACCNHVLRLSKLFFCLVYLKSLFYIREPADRRKDGITWKEGWKETVKCSLEASGGPLEKKSPSSAVPSQPMTTPVRMKQFLWFAFESFSPSTFRVTSACQIPRGAVVIVEWGNSWTI